VEYEISVNVQNVNTGALLHMEYCSSYYWGLALFFPDLHALFQNTSNEKGNTVRWMQAWEVCMLEKERETVSSHQ
jgi:hypothetical protein